MRKNHTKEKQIKNIIKHKIKNCVLEKPFLTIIAISLVILALLCLIFNVFMIIDINTNNIVGLTSENLSEEISNSFFSLSIGYFNLVSAISIGVITLRLTIKIDHRNRMETLQKLKIKNILFYNQYERFTPSKLRYGDIYNFQFFIRIDLSNFNNNYSIDIEEVSWGKCTQDFKCDKMKALNKHKIHIEKSKQLSLYIFFEDFECVDLKESINYFYHINEYAPEVMKKHERYRWISINCYIKEKISKENEEPFKLKVEYNILVENIISRNGYVELLEIQHDMNIKN